MALDGTDEMGRAVLCTASEWKIQRKKGSATHVRWGSQKVRRGAVEMMVLNRQQPFRG